METLGNMLVKSYIKFIAIIVVLLSNSVAFSKVRAYLDQSTYYEGDTVTLTVETSTNNNAKPDISSLQTNFEILGTNTNSQISIINGRRSFKKSWIIELQPKIKGKLEIPEILVGDKKTKALELIITDLPPEIKAETGKHVTIETSIGVTGDKTYVQQQIPYTIKFFFDSSMQTGEISSLKIENAVTEQLGSDRRYQIVRAGKKLEVVEKNYVISPERSGDLYIPPVTVKGRIALAGSDSKKLRKRMDETDILNRFFNDFSSNPFFNDPFSSQRSQGPSKPFTASSKAINVKVLPVPAAFTGTNWLPAESLTINDSWSKNPPNFKVGEPVTRSLTLQAKGLAGSQIPQPLIPKTSGIKIYPEPAKSETHTDGKTVYGIQQLEITYIPNREGDIIIPEMSVDWWNIKTEKQQTFTLPKWHLNVAAGAQSSQQDYQENVSADEPKKPVNPTSIPEKIEGDSTVSSNLWKWALLLAILISSLVLLLFGLKRRNVLKGDVSPPRADIKKARTELLTACAKNNKKEASKALINFVKLDWDDPSIQSLGAIASNLSIGADVIKELDQSLYSADASQWQGDKLKKLLTDGLNRIEKKIVFDNNIGLVPLYPRP